MKLLAMLFVAGLTITAAAASDLTDIKTVYLLPMSGGLDQYLAVRLTSGSVLQVVTDPAKADAVFTDRIGSNLQQNLDDLYTAKPKEDQNKLGDFARPTMQPLSRGKGSIFLVDRKNRTVVWSMYAVPKSSQSAEMNRLAEKIASKLEKDRKPK